MTHSQFVKQALSFIDEKSSSLTVLLHASSCRKVLIRFNQLTQVVQSVKSSGSIN